MDCQGKRNQPVLLRGRTPRTDASVKDSIDRVISGGDIDIIYDGSQRRHDLEYDPQINLAIGVGILLPSD